MKLSWRTLLASCLILTGLLASSVDELRLAIRDCIESREIHDLVLVFDVDEDEPMREAMASWLLRLRPTLLLTASKLGSNQDRVDLLATERSLVIYLCEQEKALRQPDAVADNVLSTWHPLHAVRVLVVLVGESRNGTRSLLEVMWRKKILQVVALEIRRFRPETGELKALVHRYQPFLKVHSKSRNLSVIGDWLSEELGNMHGHEFLFNVLEENEEGLSSELEFPRVVLMLAISDVLNATLAEAEDARDADIVFSRGSRRSGVGTNYSYTEPFITAEWCFIAPVPERRTISFWKLVATVLLALTVLMIFSSVCRLLPVSDQFRDPLYIVSLILGFSVTRFPASLFERILFLTMVLVSVRYTSMLYTELFDLAIVTEKRNLTTIEDLAKTDLEIFIGTDVYKELKFRKAIPITLEPRFTLVENAQIVRPFAKNEYQTNASYLTPKVFGRVIAENLKNSRGQNLFEMTGICYTVNELYYLFPPRSVYKDRVNQELLRAIAAGIGNHASDLIARIPFLFQQKLSSRTVKAVSTTIPLPFLILFIGHGLAMLVFLGELIIHGRRNRPARAHH